MSVVEVVPVTPFDDQKMGTSGLRKRSKEFLRPGYAEAFMESVILTVKEQQPVPPFEGGVIYVGGDGRFGNDILAHAAISASLAHGAVEVLTFACGVVSTPVVSAMIRATPNCIGAFILTASHNPGGPEGDCGVKFNKANGAPATEEFTSRAFAISKTLSSRRALVPPFPTLNVHQPLGSVTAVAIGGGVPRGVRLVSPTDEYVRYLKSIFDFGALRALCQREGFSLIVDAMHGAGGPYAHAVFVGELGLPESCLKRCDPLPDFGGGHPDPNLTYAADLVRAMKAGEAAVGFAYDGDADRNMVLGGQPYAFASPSDALAVVAANCTAAIPWFKARGLKGVARSMPTSSAADVVAAKRGFKAYEVPTGWKFFCQLLDAGEATLCGEESFGMGSDHVREKDGMWATLAWLSILAWRARDLPAGARWADSIAAVLTDHYAEFGRLAYVRHDYEECDAAGVAALMSSLEATARAFGTSARPPVTAAPGEEPAVVGGDVFDFVDPMGGPPSPGQGVRLYLSNGARCAFRTSGTGSVGATLRVYVEVPVAAAGGPALFAIDPQEATAATARVAMAFAGVEKHTGRAAATVIT